MKKIRMNLLYRVLVLAFTFSIFSEAILLPIYAIFVQNVGGDILDAGIAMGIFLLTQGLFTIFIHRFEWNARQRIQLLIGGWFIWVIGISLYLIVSSVWMLFLTQVLTAIGNAVADPIFDAELASHTDKDREELEWGFFEGGIDIVSGIAAILGAVVVSIYGFTVLIYLMIATATISFVVILWYVLRLRSGKQIITASDA